MLYRKVKDEDGTEHQKSEGFDTQKEAEARKKEIEYKKSIGQFTVPKCTTDVGRILRTFKIKKNVEVTDNGKIII